MLSPTSSFNTPLQQLLLLEERVRRTGAMLPEDADNKDRFHGIKCVINGERCLVDIRMVSEVLEDKVVTGIPGAVSWIEGVMNFRGVFVPVYNVASFCGDARGAAAAASDGPLIVCRYGQDYAAVRVSHVFGMQKYPLNVFEQDESGSGDQHDFSFFTDARVCNDETCWLRFNIGKLLGVLTRQDPMHRQEESA